MTIAHTLYGRQGEVCSASDSSAFAAKWSQGTGARGAPISIARIVAKLENDRSASLTAHERELLVLANVAIAPTPRVDSNALGNELLAQGVPPAEVQRRVSEENAKSDTFVSVEPIRSMTFFRPANY